MPGSLMSITGCVYCYHNKQQTEVSVFNWEDTRHFVGTGMRRRGEIASSRDLTPGQVLVTWLREEERWLQDLRKSLGLSAFGLNVTQNQGRPSYLWVGPVSGLSLQSLKHRNFQTLTFEASVPLPWVGQWVSTHQKTLKQGGPGGEEPLGTPTFLPAQESLHRDSQK